MPDFPELPAVHELTGAEDEERTQRFTRAVAAAIVLSTLAAALVAFAQSDAGRMQQQAQARAAERATASLAARDHADEVAQLLVRRHALGTEARTYAAAALERAAFGHGGASARAERRRWLWVARHTDAQTRAVARAYGMPAVRDAAPTGPDQDPFFPQRYLAAARRGSYALAARRDAAAEQAEQTSAQGGRYTVALTVLAVAVFLFGYALTPHAARRRAVFAAAAAAFALGGVAWGVATAARAPEEPDPAAASAFADGRVAFESQRYPEAVRALSRAIAAWPGYGLAYDLRARAEFAAGSPQLDVPLSLSTGRALAAATADEARALDRRTEDTGLLLDHGFHLIALGLRRDDDGAIEEGVGVSERAMEERPDDPQAAFNVGLGELALGRRAAAERAYGEAVDRVLREDDYIAFESDLGGALTDLELLAGARPRLRGAVERAKLALVTPITSVAYGGPRHPRYRGPPAAARAVRIAVDPGYAALRIVGPRHIGDFADLSAQWSYRVPGLGWTALPDVSGAINDPDHLLLADNGDFHVRASYLGLTGACLAPGTYRLDVYVNGRLVARTQRVERFPALTAARLPELGADFCRPRGWRPAPGRAPGLLDGAAARGGRAGMLVLSLPRGPAKPSVAQSRRGADAALRHFAGRLPVGLGHGAPSRRRFAEGLRGVVVRGYRYRGGRALVGAGATQHGARMLVAVAWGPAAFMARTGAAVFGSLSLED